MRKDGVLGKVEVIKHFHEECLWPGPTRWAGCWNTDAPLVKTVKQIRRVFEILRGMGALNLLS